MSQSNDIEDVLSSIRRLIAADDTVDEEKAPPAPQAGPLILDPSTRIREPADPFNAVSPIGNRAGPNGPDDARGGTERRSESAHRAHRATRAAAPQSAGEANAVPASTPDDARPSSSAPSRAEADGGDGPATEAAPAGDRPASPGLGIDDVALRELVAEVVREELAGELGARITRNVRKLVRREIRQAIASETLD